MGLNSHMVKTTIGDKERQNIVMISHPLSIIMEITNIGNNDTQLIPKLRSIG